VGITGTNGKTTTKDMTSALLSKKYKTLCSEGSFNNQVGLPLTLFRLNPQHEVGVLEMGMSGKGEIARLSWIAQPEIGVITNVGPAHLEFMKTLKNIAQAKFELLEALPKEGYAILNADDPWLRKGRGITEATVFTFGMGEEADVMVNTVFPSPEGGTRFYLNGERESFELPLLGVHNIYNALASITVGRILGISSEKMREALSKISPSPMRMERVRIGEAELINDAYNANPVSVLVALRTLASLPTKGRRIAVLGEMRELGNESREKHREVGREIKKLGIDFLVTVGEMAEEIGKEAICSGMEEERIRSFRGKKEAIQFLRDFIAEGDRILIKGSRAMQMEEIVMELKKYFG